MDETDKILYSMGYFDSDPNKKAEVSGFIAEAVELMTAAGVPTDKLTSQRAYSIKSIYSDLRDKGETQDVFNKDGMIVHLISQMREPKPKAKG